MSQDGMEAAPTMGRGSFVSGIVLGLSLGVAAAHLLMFARAKVERASVAAADEFPLPHESAELNWDPQPTLPPDVSFSALDVEEQQDEVGRVTLSDQSPHEHLHYFPDALQTPARDVVEHSDLELAFEPDSAGPLRMTAEVAHQPESPPQALQPAPAAAPIDQQTSEREQLARTIIASELPDADRQEQDVWYEVLRGLPADDIKGILRMRKHVGPQGPSALSALLAASSPLAHTPQSPAIVPPLTENKPQLLSQIQRHNQANRDTAAFKQRTAVFVEAPLSDPTGVRLNGIVRDMRQGELNATGRALDVAIDGPGFLCVRRGDTVRYTRDGRLTIDQQGRLKMLAATDDWLLDPPVVIPAEAADVTIDLTGEVHAVLPDESPAPAGTIRVVQFLNPEQLQIDTAGLYQPSAATGSPCARTIDGTPAAQLVQGHIEASNVTTGPDQSASRNAGPGQ